MNSRASPPPICLFPKVTKISQRLVDFHYWKNPSPQLLGKGAFQGKKQGLPSARNTTVLVSICIWPLKQNKNKLTGVVYFSKGSSSKNRGKRWACITADLGQARVAKALIINCLGSQLVTDRHTWSATLILIHRSNSVGNFLSLPVTWAGRSHLTPSSSKQLILQLLNFETLLGLRLLGLTFLLSLAI